MKGRTVKNPYEQLNKPGKGTLWNEGVNYASDTLLIVTIEGVRHMLAIKRKSGHWAMPGGFRNKGEEAIDAALRELEEETGVNLLPEEQATLHYSGYVQDPRNTDEAWIETAVFVVDLGDDVPHVKAGSDAQGVGYVPLTFDAVRHLYPGHAKIVRDILDSSPELITCVGCVDDLLARFATDKGPDALSTMTTAINEIFDTAREESHSHPDRMWRLKLLLTTAKQALSRISERVDERISGQQRLQTIHLVGKFMEDRYGLPDTTIDRALDLLVAASPIPAEDTDPEVSSFMEPGKAELLERTTGVMFNTKKTKGSPN